MWQMPSNVCPVSILLGFCRRSLFFQGANVRIFAEERSMK